MRRAMTVFGAAAVLALSSCSAGSTDAAGESTETLTVFAAASLTDVFGALGDQFTTDNPGVEINFNFAGSSALATQINQGAPADVFASANEPQMTVVTDAGEAAAAPTPFAENMLVIAVPAGNPAGVTGLAAFADPELTLAVCAPQVPCGAAADAVFAAAGITPSVDTFEEDVRAALTKVELGEVDAALVYTTDTASAGTAVAAIAFPEAEQHVNVYPIVTLTASTNPEAAQAFIDLVLSEAGQAALREAGFRSP